MTQKTNQDIVIEYLTAFGNKDFATVRSLLADNFTFEGPLMQASSADEFVGMMQGFKDTLDGIDLYGTAQDGDWVGSYYIFKTFIPTVERTVTSEWFKLENGKIVASYLVFDATKWQPIMAAQNAG
ncbi:MAG: nuclear transport factor 2 family protein [Formosimonas sp.]